jgi:hypothetical protein
MRLCDAVPAQGAALVDAEGETVDYAGTLDPFDIKVAAAEMCVLLAELRRSSVYSWPQTEEVLIRGARRSYYAHALAEGYSVVLELLPHAFGVSRRAIREALRELCKESGLDAPHSLSHESEQWVRVDVRCMPKSVRPSAVWLDGSWCSIEILGTYRAHPVRREVGFRARLPSGAEITLIREPLGRWYADQLPRGR